MGRYEDELEKHLTVISKAPSPGYLNTETIFGDGGLILEEHMPFGMVAVITPTTNSTETIADNTISMVIGGNAMVFDIHPTAKQISVYCLQLLNRTIVDAGGPENLITAIKEPAVENVSELAANPRIHVMAGAGGMDMVNTLPRSGKKTIGAGADNPLTIVGETAGTELTGREIYKGTSSDSNTLCFTEKKVFMVEGTVDDLFYNLCKQGAYLLDNIQIEHLPSIAFQPKKQRNRYEVSKQWVGRDASRILEQTGVTGMGIKLLICEVERDRPLVTVEQMMPILPIVRYQDFE